jgi:hypothetical protein
LFLHLRTFLAWQNFTDRQEPKSTVENWLNTQTTFFCDEGIPKISASIPAVAM